MVCWLRLLKRVSEDLKSFEPDLVKRKRLAIEILKNLEKERGHNVEVMEKALEEIGAKGLVERARKELGRKKRRTAISECEIAEVAARG